MEYISTNFQSSLLRADTVDTTGMPTVVSTPKIRDRSEYILRGVGFDFDHTLGVDKKLERNALLDILSDEELQEDLSPDACRELVDEALQCYRSGAQELDSALTDLFARALVGDYDPAELIVTFRQLAVKMAPQYIEALPGAGDLFAMLHDAGIKTAILTNGWAPLQNKKAELVGFNGPVLVSDALGFRKPDPRAFTALTEALALPPSDILFVGDAPAIDIAGALNFGMPAAWYNWEKQTYDPKLPPPTYTIAALSEIVDLVLASPKR